MSFQVMLNHPASQDGIRQRVLAALQETVRRRHGNVSESMVQAAVTHGIEEAVEDVVSKVASWNVCAETFHDAFMMVVQKAETFATQKLSHESEEQAFHNLRPEMPMDFNESQAENIMQSRHPKNLQDL